MDATTKTNIMRTGKGQTKRDKKDGKVVVYFSGHDRVSWPDPLQIPHVRVRLGGGGAVSPFSGSSGFMEPPLLPPGFGTDGCGQTVSLSGSGQNGLILSYRYHWRSAFNPRGGTTAGKSSSAAQGAFRSSNSTSADSLLSLTKTDPGEDDGIRK